MIFPKIWVGPYYYLIVPENKHNLKVNLYLHSDLTWGTQIRKYMEREDALTSDKLSILKPMRKFNHFQVDDIMALRDWMDEEDSDENSFDQEDPRGFIQWYFRFYIGRRIPDIDRKQILRWQKFGKRFLPSLKNSCKEKDMKCKPKLRQSLIQWGYDSREI